MKFYCGIDLSARDCHVCVIDEQLKIVIEQKLRNELTKICQLLESATCIHVAEVFCFVGPTYPARRAFDFHPPLDAHWFLQSTPTIRCFVTSGMTLFVRTIHIIQRFLGHPAPEPHFIEPFAERRAYPQHVARLIFAVWFRNDEFPG